MTLVWDMHFRDGLVPRPSPSTAFDCLQYAKMEREGLGDFVTCTVIHVGGSAQ